MLWPPSSYVARLMEFLARYGVTRPRLVRFGVPLLIFILGFVLGGQFGGRLYSGAPPKISKITEINRLLQKVSRHFVLGSGEPKVATVQDPRPLKNLDSIFFRDAENGDRMIVWPDRAVLYSTKRDLVLAAIVAPGIQAPWETPPATTPTAVGNLTFEIRNGSGRSGAGLALAARLKEKGLTVMAVGDAAKTYPETRVVPLSDRAKSADQNQLTAVSGGAASALPEGEKKSAADVLVIIGEK